MKFSNSSGSWRRIKTQIETWYEENDLTVHKQKVWKEWMTPCSVQGQDKLVTLLRLHVPFTYFKMSSLTHNDFTLWWKVIQNEWRSHFISGSRIFFFIITTDTNFDISAHRYVTCTYMWHQNNNTYYWQHNVDFKMSQYNQ